MIPTLLAASKDIDKPDNEGVTALMYAAGHHRHCSISAELRDQHVKLLLQAGANTLIRDKKGKTALDHAKEAKHLRIVWLLEEKKQKLI